MQEGTIIKIISNQYTVRAEGQDHLAVLRGRMRLKESPMVGDKVRFEALEDQIRIDSILPRHNQLLRPSVANVDQALVVTSCKDPDFSEHLLNRLLFLVQLSGIQPVICITKMDLVSKDEKVRLEGELDKYRKAGYPVLISHPGSDDDKLRQVLQGKTSVLCGQSGAGKSSLLNRLEPSFALNTQEISKALGRGKHTTRHTQLHDVAGGLVADTPGFSSLDFSRVNTDHLDQVLLDFAPYLGQCRFADCIHVNEPDCAVKDALARGEINPSVYEDYKQIKKENK